MDDLGLTPFQETSICLLDVSKTHLAPGTKKQTVVSYGQMRSLSRVAVELTILPERIGIFSHVGCEESESQFFEVRTSLAFCICLSSGFQVNSMQ